MDTCSGERATAGVRRAATYLGGGSAEGWQLGHSIKHQISPSGFVNSGAAEEWSWRSDDLAAYLQHVQQCGLAGIVETKEKKLGMLVEQTQGGQNVVDYCLATWQLAYSVQDA